MLNHVPSFSFLMIVQYNNIGYNTSAWNHQNNKKLTKTQKQSIKYQNYQKNEPSIQSDDLPSLSYTKAFLQSTEMLKIATHNI